MRRGFTLIELLVVIGIIILLLGILVPVLTRALGKGERARLTFQMQTIVLALDAYKTDFGDYPMASVDLATNTSVPDVYNNDIDRTGVRGARLLCKALIAPGPAGGFITNLGTRTQVISTGQDGFGDPSDVNATNYDPRLYGNGFRVTNRTGDVGKRVYGPYLNTDSFKVGWNNMVGDPGNVVQAPIPELVGSPGFDETKGDQFVILDATGQPILYFPPINPRANIATIANVNNPSSERGGFVGSTDNNTSAMYRSTDNSAWLNVRSMRYAMGDKNNDGVIGPGEEAAITSKYILWFAGADQAFFSFDPALVTTDVAREKALQSMDDVTSFTQ